jgi:deoxyribose-phosphate aldolase
MSQPTPSAPKSGTLSEQDLARRLLALLDLTSLNDNDDADGIRRLAALASTAAGSVAALCIWPRFIGVARAALHGKPVPVATVGNFPSGLGDPQSVAAETAQSVASGADEVDVVFPYRALLAGDAAAGPTLVRASKAACGGRLLKVILECGQLGSPDLIQRAAELAIEGGADFLKTSTGKTKPGPTLEAASAMLDAIAAAKARGVSVGFKVSGGVGTIAQAQAYLDLYERRFGAGSANAATFRIGSSTLITPVLALLR